MILGFLMLQTIFLSPFMKEVTFTVPLASRGFRISESNSSSITSKSEDRWLSKDKALHLTVSLFLTGLTYRVYHDEFRNPEENSRLFAFSFTSLLGIGKEMRDSLTPSATASWKDLTADGVGIFFGLLLFTTTF